MSTRVLTVCLGNICRSPAAEAAIRREAERQGVPIAVESAGTGDWHVGDPPHPRSVAAGAEVGLAIAGEARQVTAVELAGFDLVVAMDRQNLADLVAMAPQAAGRIRLLRSFDDEADDLEVPDPYWGTEVDYRKMIEVIVPAAEGLVRAVRDGRV